LAAHLSQWVSGVLTQRLISQRHTLLETHDTAAAEIAALEARLEQVQAPLQARLAAYERRIAELERELAARDAENRELLRAKIDTMRKQLEEERGKNRMKFN
jgi:septal ring factor EnvC (AmiA/AmiB activator)